MLAESRSIFLDKSTYVGRSKKTLLAGYISYARLTNLTSPLAKFSRSCFVFTKTALLSANDQFQEFFHVIIFVVITRYILIPEARRNVKKNYSL